MPLTPVRILKPNLYESGCVLYLTEDSVDGSTWKDLSGYKNHGTINGATLVSGSGLYFDGTDDLVVVNDANSLDITNELTILSKFKTSYSFNGVIIRKASSYEIFGNELNSGKVAGFVGDGSSWFQPKVISTNTYNDGKWHFVALVYNDANDTLKLYVDSDLEDSETITGSLGTSNSNLGIGADSGGSYYYKGYISDLKIFNKSFNQSKIFAHNRNSRFLPNRIII